MPFVVLSMLAAVMLEGLPPNDATHVMRLTCDEATARTVADIIVETFDPATTAAAAFEETPDTSSWKSGAWAVEVYFGSPPDEANIRGLVAIVAGDSAAEAAVFGELRQRDWVASSLEGLVPCGQGGSWFMARMAAARPRPMTSPLRSRPRLLSAPGIMVRRAAVSACWRASRGGGGQPRSSILAPARVSLAIAAAKLFKRAIHAGDIDPVCVTAASANARCNRVPGFVRPVLAKGSAHPALRKGGHRTI